MVWERISIRDWTEGKKIDALLPFMSIWGKPGAIPETWTRLEYKIEGYDHAPTLAVQDKSFM